MRKKPEGRLGLNRNLKNLSYVDGAGLLRNPLAEVKKTYVFLPSAYFLRHCECENPPGFSAEGERATTKSRKSSLSPSALYLRIIEDDSEVYRS